MKTVYSFFNTHLESPIGNLMNHEILIKLQPRYHDKVCQNEFVNTQSPRTRVTSGKSYTSQLVSDLDRQDKTAFGPTSDKMLNITKMTPWTAFSILQCPFCFLKILIREFIMI